MKRKLSLVVLPIALVAVFSILTGGPKDESNSINPVAANEEIQARVAPRGLTSSLSLAAGFETFGPVDNDRSFHSDIAYFETVVSYGTNTDPRVTFLLVNAYLANNQQVHGIAFFERLLKRYGNVWDGDTRATYLAGYAILRATYADNVPLLSRIGWMYKTFDLLEEAATLTNNENPLIHWASGLIYAQVPFFFFKKDAAYAELNWLAERPETEPLSGFYREVYHHLAKLHASDGNADLAAQFLTKSGYDDYEPKSLFMGWFTTTKNTGGAMSAAPELEEIVLGKVFAIYGLGFAEIYFVISDDGSELIAVDAGTRPDLMQKAHELLLSQHPDLPKVTTVITTHAHWDHIGGLSYLKSLNPDLTVYGRSNYSGTVERVTRNHSYQQFRGADFDHGWVDSYHPDVPVSQRTDITIGGTSIELIPVQGGETEDAMLVFMPDMDVIFTGDILMPYYGEPWVEEGFIDGAIATMDEVIERNAKHVLHGHRPLTMMYGHAQIEQFRDVYKWLVDATRDHIRNGYSVNDITRLNLIPPGLQQHPEIFLSYIAPREHIIARIADNMVGIWQEDVTGQEPAGLYNLTSVEYGRLLEVYLDLSPNQVASALRKMIDHGDNELALHLAVAAEKRYAPDAAITQAKEEAADRLRSAAQFFDPFKFVTYSEMTGKEHKPIPNLRATSEKPAD